MTPNKTSVVLVGDHVAHRESTTQALENTNRYYCTGQFPNITDLLESSNKGINAKIILVGANHLESKEREEIEILNKLHPNARIIVLTPVTDREKVFDLLKARVHGYLITPITTNRLIDALDEVMKGATPIDPQITDMMLNTFRRLQPIFAEKSLSNRECEILLLIADGMTKQQIASKLNISTHTVSTYLRRVFDKLKVHSLPEAVCTAIRQGLLDFSL